MKKLHLVSAAVLSIILAGCGGGGSSGDSGTDTTTGTTTPTPPVTTPDPTPDPTPQPTAKNIQGQVSGLVAAENVVITASGGGELHTQRVDADGGYSFNNLTPGVNYSLKVQARGYRQQSIASVQPSNQASDLIVETQPTPELNGKFHYVWQDDGQSVSGLEYASAVNQPITVEIEGLEKAIPNIAAAQMLYRDYRVVLDDTGDLPWTQAHAYRLLETMRQLPQKHCSLDASVLGLACKPVEKNVKETRWTLDKDPINKNITISGKQINISVDAFSYAEPQIATVDGQRGRFYSKDLHHAVVNYLTSGGANLVAANYILQKRFGVTIDQRGNGSNHSMGSFYYNTPVTGAQDRQPSAWQSFTPEEIMIVINQLEEMPTGLHIIRDKNDSSRGLKQLLRRANGHDHPLYPDAPAVAWPGAGYIEFMEKAFKGNNLEHMQRLVLHEKAHFLWHYVVSSEMKKEWLQLSQWYRVDSGESVDDYLSLPPYSSDIVESGPRHTHGTEYNPDLENISVDASDGWSAKKTTNFVSGYAQLKNPNEDLAESISYFLNNPDKLRSRAPQKYEFIRNKIMGGIFYLQSIRDDLTFEVLNLHPDYIYPGKIKQVEVTVNGEADQNKRVTIDLRLHTTKSTCTLDKCLEGASLAFTRIFSQGDTFKDVYFRPVGGSVSNHLRASFTLPETAKNGWWAPAQITITDPLGNERYQRSTDYGWQMFINNPDEDTAAPQYIEESMELELSDPIAAKISSGKQVEIYPQGCIGQADCREIRTITAEWDVDEDVRMRDSNACFARFANQNYSVYSADEYGEFTKQINGEIDGRCSVQLVTTEYYRSGKYSVAHVTMQDRALNRGSEQFAKGNSKLEASPEVSLPTGANVDTNAPELNISKCSDPDDGRCISVVATPTNPDQPNGETKVTITYWAKDDKSGLGTVSYKLRDPQGVEHFNYAYHNNTHTLFFNGDPAAWKKYIITETLPVGSAPGKWGVASMTLLDKAGNRLFQDFTKTVIFEPIQVK